MNQSAKYTIRVFLCQPFVPLNHCKVVRKQTLSTISPKLPDLLLVGSPGPLNMLGMGTSVGIYIPPAVVDSVMIVPKCREYVIGTPLVTDN